MTTSYFGGRPARALVAAALVGGLAPWAIGMSAAHAVNNDRDDDGMPNRWETRHGLNPRVANAAGDKDGDRLSNLAEFRRHSDPADEDTDGDGHDDGDEVRDGLASTALLNDDTNDNGVLDGDDDADRDGIDNEDEDDAREQCGKDDDDSDDDHVDDEDENEQGTDEDDSDSNGDGIEDGDDDFDEDGVSNEDMDDADDDACDLAEEDEDSDDEMGVIASFDSTNGDLVVRSTVLGRELTFVVTEETEIEFEDGDGTKGDLVAGTRVVELELDDETGALEEIELYGTGGSDESDDADESDD